MQPWEAHPSFVPGQRVRVHAEFVAGVKKFHPAWRQLAVVVKALDDYNYMVQPTDSAGAQQGKAIAVSVYRLKPAPDDKEL